MKGRPRMIPTPPPELFSATRMALVVAEALVGMVLSAAVPVSLVVFAVLTF
ncbi:hypothetical protein [Caulobacter segnis]|uniref:hypothetical protein n=1 Tax=Caulobacter segnis TaxID=88688 RepID=UPI0026F27BAE|nr:hypothetical protein [Caulobacter segnis]